MNNDTKLYEHKADQILFPLGVINENQLNKQPFFDIVTLGLANMINPTTLVNIKTGSVLGVVTQNQGILTKSTSVVSYLTRELLLFNTFYIGNCNNTLEIKDNAC